MGWSQNAPWKMSKTYDNFNVPRSSLVFGCILTRNTNRQPNFSKNIVYFVNLWKWFERSEWQIVLLWLTCGSLWFIWVVLLPKVIMMRAFTFKSIQTEYWVHVKFPTYFLIRLLNDRALSLDPSNGNSENLSSENRNAGNRSKQKH